MFESKRHFPSSSTNKASSHHHSPPTDEKRTEKSAPKSVRLLLAQLINSFIEYTSELTYFSINAFQTSSLKRVQTTTLTRFDRYCVPRACAFYYSLDREFEEFVLRMRKLCRRTRNAFLDIRSARIHHPQSAMFNIPDTHRSLDVLKCNIERLRDLKQIHQDLGHDLLLPNDQLFLSLDLLMTNYQLILCELDNQVRFRDAILLQTFVNDIFLQCRVVLTWLYPAIKMAAYRIGDPNKQSAVKRCENIEKPSRKISRTDRTTKELNENEEFPINHLEMAKSADHKSPSVSKEDFTEEKTSMSTNTNHHASTTQSASYNTSLSFIKRPFLANDRLSTEDQHALPIH